jgi:signal peptide peptidase SppA
MKQYLRILAEIHERPWAITDRSMRTILDVLERPVADLEAVAARIGRPLENTGNRVEMRGPVAILGVEGPLFRFANLFTEISGATSVERLATDFTAALDNPQVQHIVLNVNSPGGQVDGINELADMIRYGSSRKPVTAYVDGLAASGGYWLAAAANRIVANESSFLGSIGVVATITDNRDAQERQGVKRYEIVSSQSPLKRTDIRTEEGKLQIQAIVDSLAELFIGRLAAFRSVSRETVAEKFGRGGMFIARQAVDAGMADAVSNFEALVTDLSAPTQVFPITVRNATQGTMTVKLTPMTFDATGQPIFPKEEPMADTTIPAPAPAAPATTPTPPTASAERARIRAIVTCEEARGREQLAQQLAFTTELDPESVRAILHSAPVTATPVPANPLAASMAQLPNPQVGVNGDADDTPQAEVLSILKYVPKRNRVA